MKTKERLKTGYAAKKARERATFYKPLSDAYRDSSSYKLADTFMPAQMVKKGKT